MASSIAILKEQQLRQLADLIWRQEALATQNINFTSLGDQNTYLHQCKANYESVISLLDGVVELKSKFDHEKEEDKVRSSIANDIYCYVGYVANSALQAVPNYTLRKSYLEKITAHVTSLTTALQDDDEKTDVELLAKEAVHYRDAMLDYLNKYRPNASTYFSQWISAEGITFDGLVQIFMNKLKLVGPFQDLKETQKLQLYNEIIDASQGERNTFSQKVSEEFNVYDEIIEASQGGRNTRSQIISEEFDVSGVAVLLFKSGVTAWHVFSADYILKEAARQAIEAVASEGGAELGTIVGVVIAIEVDASILSVVSAGLLGGIAGAFLLGVFAGWIFDLIFSSGGTAPLSTEGLITYVAPLPDGMALAYEIAHNTK